MKIEIYDPPMCCPSGICGPEVDDKLMEVNDMVLKLKEKGLEVNRYLINQQPDEFMNQEQIKDLLEEKGVDILPITVVEGEVIKKEDYPTEDEIEDYVDLEETK